ncbi:TPA: hypothetical protein IGP84_003358 [Escherichia coli]|nr:hypothetical protein [Escherichia coli]
MNTAALYNTIISTKRITHTIAKLAAWIFGLQTAALFMLATASDAPLPYGSTPAIRFAIALIVLKLAPHAYNAILTYLARKRH